MSSLTFEGQACRVRFNIYICINLVSYANVPEPAEEESCPRLPVYSFGLLARFYADDTHLTRAVPAVLRLHPQLLVAVDQAIGAACPLAVAALQLGEPRLRIVQLQTSTQSLEHLDHVKDPRAQRGGPPQPLPAGVSDERVEGESCSATRRPRPNHSVTFLGGFALRGCASSFCFTLESSFQLFHVLNHDSNKFSQPLWVILTK